MKQLFLLVVVLMVGTIGSLHAQTVQCMTTNGAWGPCPLNASVQLMNGLSAHSAVSGTAQKVYNFSMNGTLIVNLGGITTGGSGCSLQVLSGDSLAGC